MNKSLRTIVILLSSLAPMICGMGLRAQSIRLDYQPRSSVHSLKPYLAGNSKLIVDNESDRDAYRSAGAKDARSLEEPSLIAIREILSALKDSVQSVERSGELVLSCLIRQESKRLLCEQRAIQIKLHYEARDWGGLLTATLEVRPAFSGVGVTNLPTLSQSQTEIVEDRLSQQVVDDAIHHLSEQIFSKTFAAFSN